MPCMLYNSLSRPPPPIFITLAVWPQTMRKDLSVVSSSPRCTITSCPRTTFRSAWGRCTCSMAFTSCSPPGQRKRCCNWHCHHYPPVSFISVDLCIYIFIPTADLVCTEGLDVYTGVCLWRCQLSTPGCDLRLQEAYFWEGFSLYRHAQPGSH